MYKFVIIGIVSVLLFWIFLVGPELKQDLIPLDMELEQRGIDQIVSIYGGELSEPFIIEEVTKYFHSETNDGLLVSVSVSGINLEKNKLIFQYDDSFLLDPQTGKHLDESLGYFHLPFNLEKKDYAIFNPIITAPTIFVFKSAEELYTLPVYHFSCDTYENDFSSAFPQFAPRQIFIDYDCDVWVEPITGNIVHYKSNWDTYFVEDGIRTLQAEVGGKENSVTTINSLLEITKREIDTINFYEITIPIIIGFVGILFLSSIVIKRGLQRQQNYKEESKKLVIAEKMIQEKTKQFQDEKLKLIGTLTSVLIHDINNPLSILSNESDILQFRLKENLTELNKKSFNHMDTAIQRIIDQIRSVMDFIKEKQIDIQQNSLDDIINDAINTTNIPNTVKLNLDISKYEIECDRVLLTNVFSNLIKNAIDATKDGEISIKTNDKQDFVEIKIIDSGTGILDNDFKKIFEYFSTTKKTGTGIGLAECKTTIEMHDGTINVKNNDGPGTTFTILIPKKQSNLLTKPKSDVL